MSYFLPSPPKKVVASVRDERNLSFELKVALVSQANKNKCEYYYVCGDVTMWMLQWHRSCHVIHFLSDTNRAKFENRTCSSFGIITNDRQKAQKELSCRSFLTFPQLLSSYLLQYNIYAFLKSVGWILKHVWTLKCHITQSHIC